MLLFQLCHFLAEVVFGATCIIADVLLIDGATPKFTWTNTITGKDESHFSLTYEHNNALYQLAALEVCPFVVYACPVVYWMLPFVCF